jgi:hypothetical protein
MVIFGAGASYDSCSSFPPQEWLRSAIPHRPPLAKELFLPLDEFRSISQQYSRFQPLWPYLEGSENVEETMEEFRAKAENDLECRRQLLAIQYYLKAVLSRCQAGWTNHTRGASNYKTLLDQVRRCSRVCFVTFNYDTLMEEALKSIDVPMATISDHIADKKYSLIKPHGSTDWQLWIRKMETGLNNNQQPSDHDMILAPPVVGDRFIIEKLGRKPRETQGEIYFSLPALAIPTVSKQTFVCPNEHVGALKRIIPDVTKIAIVGWRAGEKHFLKMLKEGLGNKPVKLLAACGTKKATVETLKRMGEAGIAANYEAASADCGFSDFVVNRRIEPFLA